jgi:hypothetical protein
MKKSGMDKHGHERMLFHFPLPRRARHGLIRVQFLFYLLLWLPFPFAVEGCRPSCAPAAGFADGNRSFAYGRLTLCKRLVRILLQRQGGACKAQSKEKTMNSNYEWQQQHTKQKIQKRLDESQQHRLRKQESAPSPEDSRQGIVSFPLRLVSAILSLGR